MNDTLHSETEVRGPRSKKPFVPFLVIGYLFESFVSSMQKNLGILSREADLYVGSTLLTIGVLGFNSGKYCDGNTAEYLSCTRPSTFYYYGALDILLVVLGVSFIFFWFFKREARHKK